MKSTAKNAKEYIAACPKERQEIVQKMYSLIKDNLPAGYEESMSFGMITFEVPLATFPETYNKKPMQLAAIANQKGYISLYLMSPLLMPELMTVLRRSGKKLKMGKSCINFNKLDELPLDDIKEVIQRSDMQTFIAAVKAGLQGAQRRGGPTLR